MGTRLCIFGAALALICQVDGMAVDGKHVNARAVSVQWRAGLKDWGEMACKTWTAPWIGSINLFTIQNGRVARVDTIHNRGEGYACFPAFNISGTKVAFYRAAYAPVAGSGSCAEVNGGLRSVCVIDHDGGNLNKLCDMGPGDLGGDMSSGIDWPAGDWIYYIRFIDNGQYSAGANSWDIWKVNYRTRENVQVYRATGYCTYARRFQLDLAGKHLGSQSMEKYECAGAGGGVALNGVADFPPNADGTLNHVVGFCGCNAAISASGNYGNNFCGSHANLYINRVDYNSRSITGSLNMETSELMAWSGDEFDGDVEGVRWACNSDKWVLQQCSRDHGSVTNSNQVAGNWVDQAAIRLSNNPRTVYDAGNQPVQGQFYYGNCPGDMWIDGGEENKGKYEDENGMWHTVPGYDPSLAEYVPASGNSTGARLHTSRESNNPLRITRNESGALRIESRAPAEMSVRIVDMRGRTVFSSTVTGQTTVAAGILMPGMYRVCCNSQNAQAVPNFTVCR